MKKYCGSSKPYIYVSFPEGKKEQALSFLEKLSASEEGKKLNFWYSDNNTLGRKERKRIEAAHALLVFADGGSLADERFKETVNTSTDRNRNVMCVHLDELKYDTPWAKTQLGPQQAIKTRDYSNGDELVEKLKTAEIFRDVRVTSEQKRAKRRQLLTPVAALAAVLLCVLGILAATGQFSTFAERIVNIIDRDEKINVLGVETTQKYLDRIGELVFIGNERWDDKRYKDPDTKKRSPYEGERFCVYPEGNFRDEGGLGHTGYVPGSGERLDVLYDQWFSCTTGANAYYGTKDAGTIDSLENIRYMHNLKKLTVIGNNIEDISPLFELDQLEVLILDCNPIKSIEGIEALTNLKTLSLNYTDVRDITPAFGCPDLEKLSVTSTRVNWIDGISALKNLKEFTAANTGLTDIEELFECGELTLIDVGAANVTVMKGLGKCHKLEELYVDLSSLRTVETIDCSNLSVIAMEKTNIHDYSFLMPLQKQGGHHLVMLRVSDTTETEKDTLLSAIKGLKINILVWSGDGINSISELTCDLSETHTLALINIGTLKSLDGIEKVPNDSIYGLIIQLDGCTNIEDLSPLRIALGNTDDHGISVDLPIELLGKAKEQLADAKCRIYIYETDGDYVGELHDLMAQGQ